MNVFGTDVSCFSTYFSSPSNNQITRHSIRALILWSLKDKSVQVCFKEAGKWHSEPARYQPNCCLGDKLLWNYAEKNSGMMLTYEFTVGIYDCSFKILPSLRCLPMKLSLIFIQAIKYMSSFLCTYTIPDPFECYRYDVHFL